MDEKSDPPDYTTSPDSLTTFPAVPAGPQSPTPQQVQNWLPAYQPQLVLQVGPAQRGGTDYTRYNFRLARNLGIAQVIAGIVATATGIAGIVLNVSNQSKDSDWNPTFAYYVGFGIWCSVLVFLSGGFAIRAAKRKNPCSILAQHVLAIWATLCGLVMIGMSCWALAQDAFRYADDCDDWDDSRHHDGDHSGKNPCDERHHGHDKHRGDTSGDQEMLVVSVISLLASITAFVTCIWSSTLYCKIACCRKPANETANTTPGMHHVIDGPQGRSQLVVVDRRGRPLPVTPIAGANNLNPNSSHPQPEPVKQDQNVHDNGYPPLPVPAEGPYQMPEPPPYSITQ